MALRKETVMAQNLQLLGFAAEEPDAAVHAGSFDRPNEKLLLRVLHYLLVTVNPAAAQEFRFCWPIATPHDKSNFKRLVQDLEKQKLLPIGSSQASRINTGYGPRTIDLLWRLSTHAIQTATTRDFPDYTVVTPCAMDATPTAQAVATMKAMIAIKTKRIKEQYVQRSQVQNEWCEFASEITAKIQEMNVLQQEIREAQALLDANINRDVFSQVRATQRSQKLQTLGSAWESIRQLTDSDAYTRTKTVLATAIQHSEAEPELTRAMMQPDGPISNHKNSSNLSDVIRDADAFIQTVRNRIAQAKTSRFVELHTSPQSSSLVDASTQHIARLSSMVQHVQLLLARIKESNDEDARLLYLELAGAVPESDMVTTSTMKLCPPTPALPPHEEAKLANSLKKISMSELSGIAADSARRAKQLKREEQLQIDQQSGDLVSDGNSLDDQGGDVSRKLDYDADLRDEDM